MQPCTTSWSTLGGSISAEHGIGAVKRGELVHFKSEVEIDADAQDQGRLDPRGILNPGKVLVSMSSNDISVRPIADGEETAARPVGGVRFDAAVERSGAGSACAASPVRCAGRPARGAHVASAMVSGYDGHRGAIADVSVDPSRLRG